MKVQVLLTAALAAMVTAETFPGAKEKCGRLGAMEWDPDNLPEGADPSKFRMCVDHPLGAGNYWGWGRYLPDWVPRNPFADL
ncbi:hypothetical protein F66182_6208 [Fusarium sp. NRRL 66182]|nr:hypothetical protein F66182_6208 [Fusarium sp. NRRL 66182]